MAEVHNLRMNENVKFLQDTNDPGNGDLTFQINGKIYDALTNSAFSELGFNGTGTFAYDGDVSNGDILCVYVGKRPDERRTGAVTKEPAAYVKVETAGGGTVTFKPLGAEDQRSLYEIPDNFPFRVDALPAEGGAVSMDALDTELYAIIADQAGRENEDPGSLVALANSRLNAGDFVTFHTGTGAAGGVCYDSVTAVFSFAGIQRDNVTVTTRRGMTPNTAVAEAGRQLGLEHLSIVNISPAIGPIDNATSYTVECLNLPGARADVTFDINQGDAPMDPADKLVGSLLTNLPQPARYGCTFAGWADQSGTVVRSIVVPEGGTTLTAQWTPNAYTLTLIGNGGGVNGQSSAAQTITFDAPYGQLPADRRTGYRFDGWWTEPVGGDPVTADTVLTDAESKTVYAHWKDLLRLEDGNGGRLFDVTMRTETYDRNTTYALNDLTYSQIPGLVDTESNPIPTDGLFFELKPKIAAGVSDGTAHDAGDYILEITRNEDGTYASYTEIHDILVINKADWMEKIWGKEFGASVQKKTPGYGVILTTWGTPDIPTDEMRYTLKHSSRTFDGNVGDRIGFPASAMGNKDIVVTLILPQVTSKNYKNIPTSIKVFDGSWNFL